MKVVVAEMVAAGRKPASCYVNHAGIVCVEVSTVNFVIFADAFVAAADANGCIFYIIVRQQISAAIHESPNLLMGFLRVQFCTKL